MSRDDRVPTGPQSAPPDLPVVEEGQPERQGLERERPEEDTVDQAVEGPERESPVGAGDDAGVESPSGGADRANLVP